MSTFLITSGGTKVHIDEVRHVGNMSSGRFGADLANASLSDLAAKASVPMQGHWHAFIFQF